MWYNIVRDLTKHALTRRSFILRTTPIDRHVAQLPGPLTFPRWFGVDHLTDIQLEGAADPPSPDAMIVKVLDCLLDDHFIIKETGSCSATGYSGEHRAKRSMDPKASVQNTGNDEIRSYQSFYSDLHNQF
jgi:hypothetical protein